MHDRKPDATPRELQVLRLCACGFSNKEVASQLGISIKTVESHKTNGMQRLGINGRRSLLHYALEQGWLADA
jgi:two-component system response regulator NreC